MLKRVISCSLIFLSLMGSAQKTFQDIRIRQYTTNDGLPDNSIRTICKDSHGYIWLGLNDGGLCRFDGHEFRQVISTGDVTTMPADAHVTFVQEDNSGHLWIDSFHSNDACYDLGKGTFIKYSGIGKGRPVYEFATIIGDKTWLWNKNAGGCLRVTCAKDGSLISKEFSFRSGALPSDKITYINKGTSGSIWIGTKQGLAEIVGDKAEILDSEKYFIGSYTASGTNYQVTATGEIFSEEGGRLVPRAAIPDGGGLVSGVMRAGKVLYMFTQNSTYTFSSADGTVTKAPEKFILPYATGENDKEGNGFAHNNTGKILFYDARIDSVFLFEAIPPEILSTHGERYRFAISSDGILWVVTTADGLVSFNPADGSVEHLNIGQKIFDPMAGALICLIDDNAGNIWAGSQYSGLFKLTRMPAGVDYIHFQNPGSPSDLCDVVKMVTAVKDEIWISTSDGVLHRMNSRLEEIQSKKEYNAAITCTAVTPEGKVVSGTAGDGLYIDGVRYALDSSNPASISGNKVNDLAIDGSGRIWAALRDGGLNVGIEGEGGKYSFRNFFTDGFTIPRFMTVLYDKSGRIWAGTDAGLYLFHPDELLKDPRSCQIFNAVDGTLSSSLVEDIFQDSSGNIWIAETGSGFCRAVTNPSGEVSFIHYGTKDGLVNCRVRSITQDKAGNIWLMTDSGISRFDPANRRFENFHLSNMIQGDTHNYGASMTMQDGTILSGTRNGLMRIAPWEISKSQNQKNRLVITSFVVFGKELQNGTGGRIVLKSSHNSFDIKFSSLNYNDETSYSYYLEGYEKRWNPMTKSNVAKYHNVPPGRYRFRVITSSDMADSGPLLTIRIKPPFYLSFWAVLIYMAVICSSGYLIIQSRMKMSKLKTEAEIESRIREFKASFSQNQQDKEFISKMSFIMDRHMADPDFSVDDFASEMAMSRSSFYNKVNAATGYSPNKYITSSRLSKAASLLIGSKYTIEQVAYMTGIRNASYFTKLFKEEFGMTPKEYKTGAASKASPENTERN